MKKQKINPDYFAWLKEKELKHDIQNLTIYIGKRIDEKVEEERAKADRRST